MSEGTAKRLFAAGVTSVQTGSYAPIVIAAVNEYLNAWASAVKPGEQCTYISTPQGMPGSDSPPETRHGRGLGKKLNAPDYIPCREQGKLPYSCRFTFDAWNNKVDLEFIPDWYYESNVGEMPRDEGIVQHLYWDEWKRLTREQRLYRYRYNAEQCLADATGTDLTQDQKLGLETHFGGRFVNDVFQWNDEKVDGIPIGEYPIWIPLDDDSWELRKIYRQLYFDHGVDLQTLKKLALLPRTAGLSKKNFKSLSAEEQRKAIANDMVIAAVKAEADPQKFRMLKRQIAAEQEALGWKSASDADTKKDVLRTGFTTGGSPYTVTPNDIDEAIIRLGQVSTGKAPVYSGTTNIGLWIGAGVVVLGGGYLLWRKKTRKPPLFKSLRSKVKKKMRRLTR